MTAPEHVDPVTGKTPDKTPFLTKRGALRHVAERAAQMVSDIPGEEWTRHLSEAQRARLRWATEELARRLDGVARVKETEESGTPAAG